MPEHYQYVVAAYGLWVAVFAFYLIHLFRKSRRIRRGLADLGGKKGPA